MSPEELLQWAEKVRDTVEPEAYGPAWMEKFLKEMPDITPKFSPPLHGGFRPDCGCPVYGTCMNAACPRRMQITCGTVRPQRRYSLIGGVSENFHPEDY